jgi:hypothetical protein
MLEALIVGAIVSVSALAIVARARREVTGSDDPCGGCPADCAARDRCPLHPPPKPPPDAQPKG